MLSSSLNQAYRHLDEQPRAGHAKFRRGGEDDGDPARSDRGIESEGDEGTWSSEQGGLPAAVDVEQGATATMLSTAGLGASLLGCHSPMQGQGRCARPHLADQEAMAVG